MTPDRKRDWTATIGLALGGVFGLAGTFIHDPSWRQLCWALDGVGIVAASALLAVKYLKRDCDAVAAGFLVFAIGEGLLLSGNAAGLRESVPSYAGGVALWATGLLLISVPPVFAWWTRLTGLVAALLFGITAARISWGVVLLPVSVPLPSIGYPFLVATFGGWICALLRSHMDK